MQSDAATLPNTNNSTPVPPISSPTSPIVAKDILNTMQQGAESPLDFITKNLATTQPVTVPNPTAPNPPVTDTPPAAPVGAEPTPPKVEDPKPSFGFEEKKEETVEAKPEVKVDDDEVSEDPIKENYLKLRTKNKEFKESLQKIAAEKEELAAKVQKYETGEVVPEILKEKEDKIAELSFYQKLHNLKASPEYQEKFIKPITTSVQTLKESFLEYGVSEEELDKAIDYAVNTKSRAELNSFLSDIGMDAVGAEEVKKHLGSLKTLRVEASEAEKEPAKVLEHLQQEQQAIQNLRKQERGRVIAANARDGWVEALEDIRSEQKVHELIRKDNDPDFNQRFVDPLLQKSSEEYGRIVTELNRLGVEDLPKEVAKALSSMVLRAITCATAIETRDLALKELQEIQSSADRLNTLVRPNVGGGRPASTQNPKPATDLTPQRAASQLINSVLQRK